MGAHAESVIHVVEKCRHIHLRVVFHRCAGIEGTSHGKSTGAKATGLHYLGTIRYGIRKPGVGPQHQQGPGRPRESPKESSPLDY